MKETNQPARVGIIQSLLGHFDEFVNRGTDPSQSFEERKFAIRYNQFFLCCVLFFIAGFLFKFFDGLYLSSFVCLGSFALVLGNYYLLHRNRNRRHLAKYTLLAIVNLAVVALSYVEGLYSGTYIFLFPFIVSQTFILNYDEKTLFRLSIIISVISIFMVFVFSPDFSVLQHQASANYRSIFYLNSFLAFTVSCLFAYMVIKENKKNELSIMQERIFLDAIFNTSLHAVFIVDPANSIILDCNRQAIELFGVNDKKDILYTPVSKWMLHQYDGT